MNKEFIPYEQALELKKLGFNEECLNKFYTKPNSKMFCIDEKGRPYPIKNTSNMLYTIGEHYVLKDDNVIIAPLYQQAFRWFREKYDLNIFVYANTHISIELSLTEPKKYFYLIDIDTEERSEESKDFNTYEEAELECLKKLIELKKNG
jgi:hypothetical protein